MTAKFGDGCYCCTNTYKGFTYALIGYFKAKVKGTLSGILLALLR